MKILYIEDEKDIANLCQIFLHRKGHSVTMTVNGQAGIDAYMREFSSGTPFDLVITDYRMPIKCGAQVINEILAVRPEQRIILTTAYGNDYAREAGIQKDKVPVLTKPFGFDDLGKLVEKQALLAAVK